MDDVLVYKFGGEDYLVVVNASNRHKDYAHMSKNALDGTEVTDLSDSIAQVALQGPNSQEILSKLVPEQAIPSKYYTAVRDTECLGMKLMISRTGYTGEDGFEIYTANDNAERLWNLLREAGSDCGLIPCGLGARDTLRLEAAMPLYGHEMDESITPIEAGLGFGVKLGKGEFIGREKLIEKGEPARIRVGLEVTGRGIVREHQDVFLGDEKIGHSTSGTHCPYLGKAVAMALIDKRHAALGTTVEVDVRGRRVEAKIVKLPFYTRS